MMPFYENRQGDLFVAKEKRITFPMHLHMMLEIIYVFHGTVETWVDGQHKTLQAGEMAVMFPHQIHAYESTTESESAIILVHEKILKDARQPIGSKVPATPFFTADSLSPKVRSLVQELTDEFQTTPPDVSLALCRLVFARLLAQTQWKDRPVPGAENLISKAILYSNTHFTEKIALAEVARAIGVSKYYLSRIFSKNVHTSFPDYINYLRVDYAKNLLRTTQSSVTEIALESGFENTRTFNRCFKQISGVTPTEFRRHA